MGERPINAGREGVSMGVDSVGGEKQKIGHSVVLGTGNPLPNLVPVRNSHTLKSAHIFLNPLAPDSCVRRTI